MRAAARDCLVCAEEEEGKSIILFLISFILLYRTIDVVGSQPVRALYG